MKQKQEPMSRSEKLGMFGVEIGKLEEKIGFVEDFNASLRRKEKKEPDIIVKQSRRG